MIKTGRTKRTFSPEFKIEAIELFVKYHRDVREVGYWPGEYTDRNRAVANQRLSGSNAR